jgi:hypothetical protein
MMLKTVTIFYDSYQEVERWTFDQLGTNLGANSVLRPTGCNRKYTLSKERFRELM